MVLSVYGWVNLGSFGYLVRDAYTFSFCLLVALVAYRLSAAEGDRCRFVPTTTAKILFLASVSMLGLLPLIKGSLLPMVACTTVVACALFLAARSWTARGRHVIGAVRRVVCFLETCRAAVAGAACVSINNERGHLRIYRGHGSVFEPTSRRLVLCDQHVAQRDSCSLWSQRFAAAKAASDRNLLRLSLSCLQSRVRPPRHTRDRSWRSDLLYTLLVAALVPFKLAIVPIVVALFAWGTIDQAHIQSSPTMLRDNFVRTYTTAFRGLAARLGGASSLEETFRQGMTSIANSQPIPKFDGSADSYSFQQAVLLASPNVWSPRPVIQSYAAYTPALLEMNARHLQGPRSPDHILFRVEPIDGRLPSLDDGLSWPVLLMRYATKDAIGAFVHLARREGGSAPPSLETVYQGVHHFNEDIGIPPGVVFGELDVAPNLWGRLMDGLFKRHQINIRLAFVDGRTVTYRFVSGMGRTPFLISPVVTHNGDFVLLSSGNLDYLDANRVKGVRLTAGDGWRSSFTVRLSTLAIPRTDISVFGLLDPIAHDADGLERAVARCDFKIDAVNGRNDAGSGVTAHGALSIAGWAVVSGKAQVSSDAVFVTLTDASGTQTMIRARSVPRPDIRQALRLPDSAETGFEALFDVSRLRGRYSLGIALVNGNQIVGCREYPCLWSFSSR